MQNPAITVYPHISAAAAPRLRITIVLQEMDASAIRLSQKSSVTHSLYRYLDYSHSAKLATSWIRDIMSLQAVTCSAATSESDIFASLSDSTGSIPSPSSEALITSKVLTNLSPEHLPAVLSICGPDTTSEMNFEVTTVPLPIDVTMAALSPPMSPNRSPMRHVPSRIHTDMSGLAPNAPGTMIDSPWPLSPLLSGTTAVESLKGSAPSSPIDGPEPMTLAAVFSQLSVHPQTLQVPDSLCQQRVPRSLQTINHSPLSVRFDNMATPTNQRQTLHSAIPFSPCTPKAMSFPVPWVAAQSPAGIDDIASSCTVPKTYRPAFEELSTPVCRAYYFDTHTFPRPIGETLNPSAYEEDAPMLALQSDSQNSVTIYDRIGERMLEVIASGIPPWTKETERKNLKGEQGDISTSDQVQITA